MNSALYVAAYNGHSGSLRVLQEGLKLHIVFNLKMKLS